MFLVRNDGFCPLAPDAVLVAAADTEPCSQLLVQENLQPGNYIVIVTGTGFDGPGCSTGFNDYWITMSCESGVSPPSNDDCTAPLDVLAGTTNFTTVGATPSGSVATCVGGGGGLQDRDVFFRYVPTFTGMALIDTCSNGATDMADTVLNVFDDCFFGSELACSDDSCGLLSRVWVPVTEGVPVFIRVAGFGASFGTGVLNISEWQQCDLQAPGDAIIESEGCGGSTNDGCSTDPAGGFDNIECGQTVVGTADAELNTRDLDWYLLNQFVDARHRPRQGRLPPQPLALQCRRQRLHRAQPHRLPDQPRRFLPGTGHQRRDARRRHLRHRGRPLHLHLLPVHRRVQ